MCVAFQVPRESDARADVVLVIFGQPLPKRTADDLQRNVLAVLGRVARIDKADVDVIACTDI